MKHLSKHHVVIIPGIFKREGFVRRFRTALESNDTTVEVYRIAWVGKDSSHASYAILRQKIQDKVRDGYAVSLIGTSAGASVARLLFNDPSLRIASLVTICGPVTDPNTVIFRIGKRISPTWKSTLEQSSVIAKDIAPSRITTIIPRFDELVPLRAMHIEGANTVRIPGVEHLLSITAATSQYSATITDAINME